MRPPKLLAAVPAGILAASAGAGTPAAAATAHVMCRLADTRIAESSGVAVSIRTPGVLWTHNDSGDPARLFAINAKNCKTIATYTFTGATNVDWEDMAVARDRSGTPSLYLADIGDNTASRSEVAIYRVDEPAVTPGDHTLTPPAVWRLRYPDGKGHDAEALLVAPGGWKSIATKSLAGVTVYRVPRNPDATRVQTLSHPVSGPDIPLVTGGAVSADGGIVVLRNYQEAYVWRLGGGPARTRLQRALRSHSRVVALPAEEQGEAVAVDGSRLIITSEGVHTPVYAVPLPNLGARGGGSAAEPSGKHDKDVNWKPYAQGSAAVILAGALLVFGRTFRRHS